MTKKKQNKTKRSAREKFVIRFTNALYAEIVYTNTEREREREREREKERERGMRNMTYLTVEGKSGPVPIIMYSRKY